MLALTGKARRWELRRLRLRLFAISDAEERGRIATARHQLTRPGSTPRQRLNLRGF